MEGFSFSLGENVSLREDTDGCFLVCSVPVRILRLNKSLFHLLRHVHDGGELAEFINRNPGLDMADILRILLSLTARGYLKLERIAEIEDYPLVSVIIPVRDQSGDLGECLHSLSEINYPEDRLETIVVDDGSKKDISEIFTSENIKFIRQEESLGPATCRNIGAEFASGDILAFLDADCIAGENWLRELVPFFIVRGVGAAGGYLDGYYRAGFLDRYEAVASSLNMGKRLLIEGRSASSFYIPTANLLVSREAFRATEGFRTGMHLGEDVDFCWRLRDLGYTLLYVPAGSVAHKHRNRLLAMLKRRGEYGTSEAVLYRTHRDKKKTIQVSPGGGLSFLAVALAILLMNPYPLCAIPLLSGLDIWRRSHKTRKFNIELALNRIVASTLRSYVSFCYFAFFHLVRYYLISFIGFGFLLYPLWIFGGLAIIYASVVDYYLKKPALFYPVFLFYYLLEHLAYQVGVLWGCLKRGYFGSYLLSIKRS